MMYSSVTCPRSERTASLWKAEHVNNEELATQKRIAVGRQVTTEHGTGKVVGRDHPYRFIVEITKPKEEHKRMVSSFDKSQLCYFPKEIEVI